MDTTRAIIELPPSTKTGQIITIRAMIAHDMETGYRRDAHGQMLPRRLIRRFECRLNEELIFAASLHAAIAANPWIAFSHRAEKSGLLHLTWSGDRGFSHRETRALQVNSDQLFKSLERDTQ